MFYLVLKKKSLHSSVIKQRFGQFKLATLWRERKDDVKIEDQEACDDPGKIGSLARSQSSVLVSH